MYLTQVLHRGVQCAPNKVCTIQRDRQRIWTEVHDRVARFAAALQASGVRKGDRVAILSLNSDRYFETYLACWWIGAVIVPMNVRWSATENAYSLNDSGAKTLIVDDHFATMLPEIEKDILGLDTRIFAGDGDMPDGLLGYEDLIASHEPIPDGDHGGEDLAVLAYTGGTTGFPKGVVLTHRALWSSNISLALVAKLDESVRFLNAAPMFHLADLAMMLGSAIAGGSQVFIPAFTPAAVLEAIETHKVTATLLVPTMVRMVLDHPDLAKHDLTSLRLLVYGASPMAEKTARDTTRAFPNAAIIQAYGQTETAPVITATPPEVHDMSHPLSAKLRSAGRAIACNAIRVVDANGNDVPRGQVGEVIARGSNMMNGYWNKPDATAAAIVDGWIHTGDGGYLDEDGFLFIVDRMKDMIITGGENVFSAEVENAINSHPAVAQCAVIGIPSEQWGEEVHAIVVPRDGAEVTEEEIIAHCRGLIAHYKCPRSVTLRTEPLPLSGAGKILKRELRAPYWQGEAEQVH